MSDGISDGYEWLQNFPTEGQAGYDCTPNYSGPTAHPACYDAEEVAKAAFKYSPEQNAYALAEQSNRGTNRLSNPSQGYSQNLSGRYGGSQQCQPSRPSNPLGARSRSTLQLPHQVYTGIPGHHVRPQIPQLASDQYDDIRTKHMELAHNPYVTYQRPPFQTVDYRKGPQTASLLENRPTPSVESPLTQAARPQSTSQSPPQSNSAITAQAAHRASQFAAVQARRPTQPVQGTYVPVGRAQSTSQSPYQKKSAIPAQDTQNVQRESQLQAPSSFRSSMDTEAYAPLASPKGYRTSADCTTLDPRNLTHNITKDHETQPGPQAGWKPAPTRPQPQTQAHVRPSWPAMPQRINSPATFQPTLIHSPSVSSVPPPLASPPQTNNDPAAPGTFRQDSSRTPPVPVAPPVAPARTVPSIQTANVQQQSDKTWSRSGGNNHGKVAPPMHSWQTVKQADSQPNGHVAERVPTSTPHSRGFPLLGGQNPERVTKETDSHPPPAKGRRLDNGQRQPVVPQVPKLSQPRINAPSPGHQFVEPDRSWRQSKLLRNRDDLVQRIEPSLALVKASYDPATIARDVLISAGKHPTEKMLNHHLEALHLNFTRIDYQVDLGTFRWDLADPRRPKDSQAPVAPRAAPQPVPKSVLRPAPQDASRSNPQYAPQPAHLPQYPASARPFNARNVSPYIQAQYIHARDIPLDTPLSYPPPSNWIDARAPPYGLSSQGTLALEPPTYYISQRVSPSTTLSGLPNLDLTPPLKPSPPKTSPLVFVPLPPSQNKQVTPTRPAPSHTVKQKIPSPTSKIGFKGQTAKPPPAQSPQIRRLPQPEVVITAPPDIMPQKRKPGRPARSETKGIEVAIPPCEKPVNYQTFPCQWEGCIAELHNLDAVRAHLVRVHVPHHLLCKWRGCGNTTHMAAADLFSHVTNEHISKMAWELGDGPVVPETGENH
jgi:hypothetical protein